MASPLGGAQPPSSENSLPRYQIDEMPQEQRLNKTPPRDRGGYDCEFVERPKELETDCPICLQVLRDPFQVTCCGNSFCKSCIKRVQVGKKSCPTCNEADFSVFPDKRLRRSLYAFQVRCVYQKSGCEWIGELGELDRHLNLNPAELGGQLIGCEFAAVACTHCCEYFQRRHVHAHETEACTQRPFSCDYCEDYGSVYEDVVNNHWPVCKCYPVPCPNECGTSPELQNVETHVNTVCPLTVVNCDFHYAGCEVQSVRKDMPTHLAESLLPHLSLLALHNQQLTQLTIQQKESLEELRKENEALRKNVNKNVSQKIAELRRQLKESLEESQHKIQESEAKKLKVNQNKEQEAAELRKLLKDTQNESQRKIRDLQKCSVANKHEIGALKQKVYDSLDEMDEVRRQQDEDRASLVTLQQQIGMLPPLRLTMTNYEETTGEWYSPPFYTHPQGYKMCLNVDANGWGDGEGTHVSVFAFLMRGEFDAHLKWPFRGSVVLQLCNQLQDKKHCGRTIDFSMTTDPNIISRVTSGERAESGMGIHKFVAHNDLNLNPANNCQYLKDDCLHFRIVTVDSLSEPWVLPTERTMTNFEQHKIDNDHWFSPSFYTHPRGYKMCFRVDANGRGRGEGTHVSVFAYLMRGEFDDHLKWPFRGHVTLAMLNQLENSNHIRKTIRFTETTESECRVTTGERAPSGCGYHIFIAHSDLNYKPAKNCQYLKHDCLRFQIVKVELK